MTVPEIGAAADQAPFSALTDEQKQRTMACYASTGIVVEARVVDVTRVKY